MKILHITNFASRPIVDGGSNREEALARFLTERGASRLVVQDEKFRSSKIERMMRLRRLMREIRESNPDVVVLNYPAYPFFWQHKETIYFKFSCMFARQLRKWADKSGARIVVDVMDMPAYQYSDLGFELEMSEGAFKCFDRMIFNAADRVWVCSNALSRLACSEYGLSDNKVKTVVNGSNIRDLQGPEPAPRPFRFVYSGSLVRDRGISDMIDAFVGANILNAELHISGSGGNWIAERYVNNQIIYHGSLTDDDAAAITAQCDVGLIYYPQKGYYNLAFATKLAYYCCCGVPILCTDVEETGNAIRKLEVGKVVDAAEYGAAMRQMAMSVDIREEYAEALKAASQELAWSNLYKNALEELSGDYR